MSVLSTRLEGTITRRSRTSDIFINNNSKHGDRGSTVVRCCATNRKVADSIPDGVTGFFIDIKSFRSHYGPGVNAASNRNEYQDYFLGGKGGRCVRLTAYHHPVPLSRNLRNLNFLERSGPLQACNGTALPLQLNMHILNVIVKVEIQY